MITSKTTHCPLWRSQSLAKLSWKCKFTLIQFYTDTQDMTVISRSPSRRNHLINSYFDDLCKLFKWLLLAIYYIIIFFFTFSFTFHWWWRRMMNDDVLFLIIVRRLNFWMYEVKQLKLSTVENSTNNTRF